MLVLLVLALIGLLAFIYRYARYSPWKKYNQGKFLMLQKVFFSLSVTYYLVGELAPPYPGERVLEYLVITGVVISIWAMLLGLIDGQKHTEKNDEELMGLSPDPDTKKELPYDQS